MGTDAIRWREASAYDYVDALPADALAWEFLRRNPNYQSHFSEVTSTETNPDTVDDLIRQRWGLRFRDASGSDVDDCPGVLGDQARFWHRLATTGRWPIRVLQRTSPSKHQVHGEPPKRRRPLWRLW